MNMTANIATQSIAGNLTRGNIAAQPANHSTLIPQQTISALNSHKNSRPVVQQSKTDLCHNCHINRICLNRSLNKENRSALAEITKHPKPAHKNDHIYRQGDNFNSIYIVRSGAIKLYHLDASGDQHIAGFFLPGELFGMDGMVHGEHRNTAVALDTTALCEIPFAKLSERFYTNPDLQRLIITSLCNEIHEKQQPLLQLHHKHVEVRLATFILDLAKRFANRGESKHSFHLPMARREIAQYLGMTEETISRLFTRFQKDKLLSVSRRDITVSDFSGMQALALQ